MSATVHQLHPRPDLHREEADRPVIAPPPARPARVALSARTVAAVTAARRAAGPAARATVAHTGLSLAGTWRGAGKVWRWAVADEYGKHKDTRPDLVEKTRERRRKWGLWGALAAVVGVQQLAVRWPHLTIAAAIVVFVVAGVVERRIRAGDAPEDAGRKALGKKPGSKAVRRAIADAGLGKADDLRVVGPVMRDGDKAWTAIVELPPGRTYKHATGKRGEIASSIGVDEVQVALDPVKGHNGRVALWVSDEDPMQGDRVTSPLVGRTEPVSMWTDKVFAGRDPRGRPVEFSLVERSYLIGGEPGGGKSVSSNNILAFAAMDPFFDLYLADGKYGFDLAPWEPLAVRVLTKQGLAPMMEMIEELREEMSRRYALLRKLGVPKVTREIAEWHDMRPKLFHTDEIQTWSACGDSKAEKEFIVGVADLVGRGRAAAIIKGAVTQRPAAEVVPTRLRDILSIRHALRSTTPTASDTILGAGWASQGYNAAMFNAAQRGAGFLLSEGATPVQLRSAFLNESEVAGIAKRAYGLREQAGTLPKSDARPAVRLLKQVLGAVGDREKVPTADLLAALPEHTAESLADALRPLGVRPDDLWIDSKSQRGYRRADVLRALERA